MLLLCLYNNVVIHARSPTHTMLFAVLIAIFGMLILLDCQNET